MRFKNYALLLIGALPSLLCAQSKITLNFDSESPKIVFSSSAWPTGVPTDKELQRTKQIEFPLGTLSATDNIVVWDRDTNNAAIRSVKEVKDAWAVHADDYGYVGLVKLRIEHEGAPVAAAEVTLEDKTRKQSQVLDPSSKGELTFFGIAPGEFKVSVNYRSAGKASASRQGFEVALKRDTVEPTFVVSIPQAVDTVPSASQPTKGAEKKTEAAEKAVAKPTSPVREAITYLIILVLAAGALYGGLLYFKKHQKAVADKLKTFGVELPEPPPAPVGAAAPLPSQPQPVQKIILDDAAPTPLSSPPAPVPAPATTTGQPRLVLESGQVLQLAEGENLVGRDAGLSVSLVGESTVSRKHAALDLAGQTVTAKDLGSTNGTYVNGQKLDVERVLKPGDTVQFGQVRARFEA